MATEYLTGLYNTIVLKDVVSRKKITDVMKLQSVVRFLADNIDNISLSNASQPVENDSILRTVIDYYGDNPTKEGLLANYIECPI